MEIINNIATQYATWLNNYADWIINHPVAFVSLTALSAVAALAVVSTVLFRNHK